MQAYDLVLVRDILGFGPQFRLPLFRTQHVSGAYISRLHLARQPQIAPHPLRRVAAPGEILLRLYQMLDLVEQHALGLEVERSGGCAHTDHYGVPFRIEISRDAPPYRPV